MIEALALLAFFGMLFYHAIDSLRRSAPVKFTRKGLRRMCQRRYFRACQTRQQVRVLQHVAWQMRRDGTPPPMPIHCMVVAAVLPWIYLNHSVAPQTNGRFGLAGLISAPQQPV